MRVRVLISGLLFAVFFFVTLSYSDVPQMINYQGKITTPAGALVDTTVQMIFTIYDVATDGGVLWTETQSSVVVEKGVFSILLGSVNAIPDSVFDGNVRYLGIKVGSDSEMTPRKAIVSVAYALRAGTVEGTSGGTIHGDVALVDSLADTTFSIVDGNVHAQGDIQSGNSLILKGTEHKLVSSIGEMYFGRENGSFGDIKVGIGTTTPDEELHVVGNIKMVDGNQAAGKVLTSDGSGVGTWQPVSGIQDNDWRFRITDTADTTLVTGGEWGIARSGNTLYGNADSTHVNLGVACTTGTAGYASKYCTVGGGLRNSASNGYATVAGGEQNTASGYHGTVGGGVLNTASGGFSPTVGGGSYHTASGHYATIGGGDQNTANDAHTTVAGGQLNTASGSSATVGGGTLNTASGSNATVGGGVGNTANQRGSTVGGGVHNAASGTYATVGGGTQNTTSGDSGTVAGGSHNTASLNIATVGGGGGNIASGYGATVGGGLSNAASGEYASIGGGYHNRVSGLAATVPGGYQDTVAGDYSFATGHKVRLTSNADYTFAFGNKFTTSTSHAVVFNDADNEIKVGIQTTSPTARLDVNSSTGYNQVRMRTSYTPTGTSDTNGNVGDIAWDDNYFYIKTSAGWKRVALSTW